MKINQIILMFGLIGALFTSCIKHDCPDMGCVCTEQYDPVCGSDGVEYSNECFALCAGITQWEAGPCD